MKRVIVLAEADHAVSGTHPRRIPERLQEKLKAFLIKTRDPWQIIWANESPVQGTGVNL